MQMGNRLKMVAAGHEDHFIRFYDPNSSKYIVTQIKKSNKLQLIPMQSQEYSSEAKDLSFLALVMTVICESGISENIDALVI